MLGGQRESWIVTRKCRTVKGIDSVDADSPVARDDLIDRWRLCLSTVHPLASHWPCHSHTYITLRYARITTRHNKRIYLRLDYARASFL